MKIIAAAFAVCLYVLPLAAQTGSTLEVPVAGNSWVHPEKEGTEKLDGGWENWTRPGAVWSTYVKVFRTGSCTIRARLRVPAGTSRLRCTVEGITHEADVSGAGAGLHSLGTWQIAHPGYLRIDVQGVSRTGSLFAEVTALSLQGTAIDSSATCVKSNEGSLFYFGRRGPSVHINYTLPAGSDSLEWFYNEITVPPGNDVPGSYFMADGFAEGYFGMQVNSPTERRIIFSVWSPFQTDNPKEVPDSQKIVLLRKGPGVVAGEFGDEGSGGHSHLVYPWKAGDTCRFLLQGRPAAGNYTTYTAYFFNNHTQQWELVASFNRPGTHTWLRKLHSFLENFEPETGDRTRIAWYHHQWVKPAGGDWLPLTSMSLTADATARKRYRLDFTGGADKGGFFLKNCGFFPETGEVGKPFTVAAPVVKPAVDLQHLTSTNRP